MTLARAAVNERLMALDGGGSGDPPSRRGPGHPQRSIHDELPGEPRGVFASLRIRGELRGCMGLPVPKKPLPSAVREAALNASFEDPRFPRLGRREFENSTFEVTVLTPLVEIDPEDVEVGLHGLILEVDGGAGLLLPQVPLEAGWDREQYLDALSLKAGLQPGAWKSASLKAFEGQVFRETAPQGAVEEV